MKIDIIYVIDLYWNIRYDSVDDSIKLVWLPKSLHPAWRLDIFLFLRKKCFETISGSEFIEGVEFLD